MAIPTPDKEIEIIHELGQRVLEQEKMLNQTSDACGELDRWAITHIMLPSLLTTVAFSHLHMEPESISSPDRT